MADITVTTSAHGNADDQPQNVAGPFWSSNTHGIVVFLDSSADIGYAETSDGGATWSASATLVAGTIDNMSVFYDGQNPGLSTFLVHIAYTDSVANRFRYININASTLAISSAVDIGTPTFTDPVYPSFITRTRNGNLIAAHHVLGGTNICKKSSDTGANWSSIASPFSGESGTDHDYTIGFYANTGDDADGAIIFGDLSASEISIKVYDDSANTWTETLISTGVTIIVAATNDMGFVSWSAYNATRVLLAAWTTTDNVAADLLCFEIQPTTVSSVSVTARTDVATNSAESGGSSMRVDRNSGTFYCAYHVGGTWGASVQAYYKTSTDFGVTWSSATQISTVADSWDIIAIGDYASGIQARIQWVWGNSAGSLFTQTSINGAALTPVVVLSGTLVPSATEDAVAAGGPTLIATITNGLNWATTIDDDATTSEDFIAAIVSATSETLGWNNIVIGKFYKREVLADSPLSYFRGTSSAWTDLGSVASNGTPTSLTAGAALLLSSAQASSVFNAAAAKVALSSTAGRDNLWDGGGTAEVVIRPWASGFSLDQSKIFSKIDAGAGWELILDNQAGGYVDISLRVDFSTMQGVWKVAGRIPIGVQTHVAVTFNSDSASNDPIFYINGLAITPTEETTPSGSRSSDASSNLWVGSNSSVAVTYNGEMQEVAFYATSLSATRIQAHVLAASNRYGLRYSNLTRTSATVVTLTLPAFPFFDITTVDGPITASFPSSVFSSGTAAVATPTFQITPTQRKTAFTPPTNPFASQTPGPFGNINGGLGPSAGAAFRILGAGDEWLVGIPQLGVGLAGTTNPRVLMIRATEITEIDE